jgi:selenocysteine lyase/cysteine desulfurase
MIDSGMTTSGSLDAARAFRRLRSVEFPWTAETTYLNNASIGPLPERTRRAIDAFTAKRTAPYQISDHDLATILADARNALARLINADTDEIALATNTSYGLNLAAAALPVAPGETVLVSDREFPANVYPWLQLRERGVRVELVPVTTEGFPDETLLLDRVRDPRVRLLAVSHVQFSNGYKVDLDALSAACREHDTYLVVDAIQALGQVPFDVKRTPVDVLACGCQKWLLSPWGSGFAYVRREIIERLRPPFAGWNSFAGTDDFSRLTTYDTTFQAGARRYEVGTLPFQDLTGVVQSVNLLLELGVERIAAYLDELRRPLVEAAADGAFELVSPTDGVHESAITCIRTAHPAESFHALRRAGVVSAFREGAIRLSPHCYNVIDEIERVVDILRGNA